MYALCHMQADLQVIYLYHCNLIFLLMSKGLGGAPTANAFSSSYWRTGVRQNVVMLMTWRQTSLSLAFIQAV